MPISQQTLDDWFPTFVQYLGVLLTVVLIAASILGKNDFPSAFIAAAGMVGYKRITQSVKRKSTKESNGGSSETDDRWSHLP